MLQSSENFPQHGPFWQKRQPLASLPSRPGVPGKVFGYMFSLDPLLKVQHGHGLLMQEMRGTRNGTGEFNGFRPGAAIGFRPPSLPRGSVKKMCGPNPPSPSPQPNGVQPPPDLPEQPFQRMILGTRVRFYQFIPAPPPPSVGLSGLEVPLPPALISNLRCGFQD